MTKLERNIEKVVRDCFSNNLDEDIAVALTIVLNDYDIYHSAEFPDKLSDHIELTLRSAYSIISNFLIGGKKFSSAVWQNRFVEKRNELYQSHKIEGLIRLTISKLKAHPWIDDMV